MLTGQECERSRRQQALHCGHSGKSGQRGRRVATGLRGYGACEAAEGVVQKSGAKDESSRSGTLTFNGTHASERGAAARKVEWGPALREFENFVGSRFTPACNTSLSSSHGAESGVSQGLALPGTRILAPKRQLDNSDHTMIGYRHPPLFTHEHGCVRSEGKRIAPYQVSQVKSTSSTC